MSAPARVGIIGTGWGLMHLGAFRDAGAEVVALCGARADRTRDIAAREGVPLATTDVDALIDASEIVVVASPDALHAPHTIAALRAGRAVLCEKPMTRTLDEARQVLAVSAGAIGAVSFPYRMLPTFAALHDALSSLPPLTHLAVTVRNSFAHGPHSSGDFGGVSHILDAVTWLARGRVRSIIAMLGGSTLVHGDLDTRATFTLAHVATQEPGIWGDWTLTGEGWDARLSAGYRPAIGGWELTEAVLWTGGGTRVVHDRVLPVDGSPEPWAAAHRSIARAFLAMRAGASTQLASFEHGAHLQAVFDAATRSHDRGARIEL